MQRVDADDAGLLAWLRSEGRRARPMSSCCWMRRAEVDGLFQTVRSRTLEARVPAPWRGKDGGAGSSWFGLSTRARVIVHNQCAVKRDEVDTHEKFAEPWNRGEVRTRSGRIPASARCAAR
jgi:iron(III) transport system substrate-binding protein